jgi:hypothetical protein
MGEFRYISPDEVAKRHRAARPTTLPRQNNNGVSEKTIDMPSAQRNVEQILAIGSTRYITFRNRTFRIPPLPYKLGQRVLDLHIKILADAKQVAMTGDKKAMDAFYKKQGQMAKLLWSHIRPMGKIRRLLWRIGGMRNPFKQASEAEMKQITDFFLQGRMTSSVRSMSETEAQA